MKPHVLEQIVNAVLYEGHILYPYRPAAKKIARERFTFGRVYPKAYSDSRHNAEPHLMQTECLVQPSGKKPAVEITVRFLHPMWREIGYIVPGDTASLKVLPALTVNGTLYQTWQEATEREITVTLDLSKPVPRKTTVPFVFRASRALEPLSATPGPEQPGMMRRYESVEGAVEVELHPITPELFKISARIFNRAPLDSAQCNEEDAVLMRTFGSTHMILQATSARFVSTMDPPPKLAAAAGQCKNIGAWPVLIDDEGKAGRNVMLASPVVLYDYPHITPESSGSFFEGTEIDEMLSLRVMTMREAETLSHPAPRETKPAEELFFNPTTPLRAVFTHGRQLRAGSGVRLHPKEHAGATDRKLDGKAGFIEAIEQDAEGHVHLALVVEDGDSPPSGTKQKIGHRFFYSVDEVEPLDSDLHEKLAG